MVQEVDNRETQIARRFINKYLPEHDGRYGNGDGILQKDEAKRAIRFSHLPRKEDGFVKIDDNDELKVILSLKPKSISDEKLQESLTNIQEALNTDNVNKPLPKFTDRASPKTKAQARTTGSDASGKKISSGTSSSEPAGSLTKVDNADSAQEVINFINSGKYLGEDNLKKIKEDLPPRGKIKESVNCGVYKDEKGKEIGSGSFEYDKLNDYTITVGKDKNVHVFIWTKKAENGKRIIREIILPLSEFVENSKIEKRILMEGMDAYDGPSGYVYGRSIVITPEGIAKWQQKHNEVLFLSNSGQETESNKKFIPANSELQDGRLEFAQTFSELYLKNKNLNFDRLAKLGAQARWADSSEGLLLKQFAPLTASSVEKVNLPDEENVNTLIQLQGEPVDETIKAENISSAFKCKETNNSCKLVKLKNKDGTEWYELYHCSPEGELILEKNRIRIKCKVMDDMLEKFGIDPDARDINEKCKLFIKSIVAIKKPPTNPQEQLQFTTRIYKIRQSSPVPPIFLGQFKTDDDPKKTEVSGFDPKTYSDGKINIPANVQQSDNERDLNDKIFPAFFKKRIDNPAIKGKETKYIPLATFTYKDIKGNKELKVKLFFSEDKFYIFIWNETNREYEFYLVDRSGPRGLIKALTGQDAFDDGRSELDLDPNKPPSDATKGQFLEYLKLFIQSLGREEMMKRLEHIKRTGSSFRELFSA